jgi:hypothetical protein
MPEDGLAKKLPLHDPARVTEQTIQQTYFRDGEFPLLSSDDNIHGSSCV